MGFQDDWWMEVAQNSLLWLTVILRLFY